jgi:hypothetical protein
LQRLWKSSSMEDLMNQRDEAWHSGIRRENHTISQAFNNFSTAVWQWLTQDQVNASDLP